MTDRDGQSDRGVSNLLGFVLMVGLVLSGTTILLAVGAPQIQGLNDRVTQQQAATTMSEFDSKAALVALGTSRVQEMTLGQRTDDDVSVLPAAGRVNITVDNRSGGRTTLIDRPLGAIRYDVGDAEIAYQGGGVWRSRGGHSTMISAPEYHYRKGTLTFPIIRVEGEEFTGSSTTALDIRRTGHRTVFPADYGSNPVRHANVYVTITSRYHAAWHDYFDERTGGTVTHQPAKNRVVVNLTAPSVVEFEDAVSATDADDAVTVTGNSEVDGDVETNVSYPAATDRIEARIAACESGGCTDLGAAGSTLTNDTYYADGSASLTSDTTYDTSGGDVHVVVDGDLSMKKTHAVSGSGRVFYYVKGELSFDGKTEVNTGGDPNDVVTLLHGDAGQLAQLNGKVQYTGLIYAPTAELDVNGGGSHPNNIVGAVVVKNAKLNGGGRIQYEPTAYELAVDDGGGLRYLHVTENRITVSD